MHPIDQQLARFGDATVLCIGDLMLDHFVYGEVSRVSPEAPTLVIAVAREEQLLGGAGNVARGIAALGARCIFVGVMGEDETGRTLARAFADDYPIDRDASAGRCVAPDHAQGAVRLRAPFHPSAAGRLGARRAGAARHRAGADRGLLLALPRADAVVLSDYAKGVLSPPVIRAVIDKASELGKPVIVDPKGSDFSIYRGATLITPNRKELADATRRPAWATRRSPPQRNDWPRWSRATACW